LTVHPREKYRGREGRTSEGRHGVQPRLYFPGLEPFYQAISGLAYPFIRFVTGAMLMPHGWRKFVDPSARKATIELFHKLAFEPALLIFWFVGSLELLGGLCVAVGLFTRPFAFAIAIEMLVISFNVFWPNGFFAGGRGYEHTLLWGLIALAIAARGGGRKSLDGLIGKEL
jgi:putative oxidoreductase